MDLDTNDRSQSYEQAHRKLTEVIDETEKVIVGQRDILEKLVISILSDGNILVESYPGLGKTKMVRTLSKVMGLDFSRIQNTPDLMPSDITGTHVVDESQGEKEFVFQKGPIFANMILADEINRATPKTQAAVLEAMEEKQVTMGNQTYELDKPFFLMATQNPIDQEGTYPLPEAQSDRFIMKITVDYPSEKDENKIVDRFTSDLEYKPDLEKVLSKGSIIRLQEFTRKVPIADDLREKAVKIVQATRDHDDLNFGASPRASLSLVTTSKARAIVKGRNHVSKKDIEEMAEPVLNHRIGLSFQAEKQGKTEQEVIKEIVEG